MLFCPFAKVEPVVLKIKIDHVILMVLSKFKFGAHFKATTWKKEGLQSLFSLLFSN